MSILTLRKDKTPIVFKAQADDGTLALDIFDIIGQDFFGLGITGAMVSEALKSEPNYSSITLNINSPGGDLFEGVTIYNLLKASGKKIIVNVFGLAASAASIVAMAGDEINMGLGTQMMIHEAIAMAGGFAEDLRQMADTLDSVTDSAADIYVAKAGMDKKSVLRLMADETWMNPDDAVAKGFATSVSKYKGQVSNSFDLSVFKNVPDELKNVAKAEEVVVETPVEQVVEQDDYKIELMRKRLEIEKRK